MTMITPSYLGETIEYSSLHACRSTLEDPTSVSQCPPRMCNLGGILFLDKTAGGRVRGGPSAERFSATLTIRPPQVGDAGENDVWWKNDSVGPSITAEVVTRPAASRSRMTPGL